MKKCILASVALLLAAVLSLSSCTMIIISAVGDGEKPVDPFPGRYVCVNGEVETKMVFRRDKVKITVGSQTVKGWYTAERVNGSSTYDITMYFGDQYAPTDVVILLNGVPILAHRTTYPVSISRADDGSIYMDWYGVKYKKVGVLEWIKQK